MTMRKESSAIETCTSFQVCGEATDGVEAIEKGPELISDLVIMDLAMPQMNGVVAPSLLKKKIPKIPIVLFTLYADEVNGLRHLPSGSRLFCRRSMDLLLG